MAYAMMGRAHAAIGRAVARRREQTGQGTVEYVALMLLVAGLMAGVIAAAGPMKGGGIAQVVVNKLKEAIDGVKG